MSLATTRELNIDNWSLNTLQLELGFKTSDFKLLLEAYRRRNLIDSGSISSNSHGLGGSEYTKSKFFKPVSDFKKGAIGRWVLNERGLEAIKVIEENLPVPTNKIAKSKMNTLLYKY